MNIVMAAAECAPFAKVGGLGDVMGALPKELVKLGHDVTVLLPKYSIIPEQYASEFSFEKELEFLFNGRTVSCRLFSYELAGVFYRFIEKDTYFEQDGIYTADDNGERYAFFCRAVLEFLNNREQRTDIIHVHDWHTAVIPFLLKEDTRYTELNEHVKTFLTIHNLLFQGVVPASVLTGALEMEERHIESGSVTWNNSINLLKTGIVYADLVTTVSKSYRDEILTERFGAGLHPLLQEKGENIIGIVNGIDTDAYNPAADSLIAKEYNVSTVEEKAVNKRAVQARFGLPERADVPLLTIVTRLSGQKGIDVLQKELPNILETRDIQFVLLGSGEEKFETFFRQLAADYPDKTAAFIGFDEALAHLLYAGADIFLMPSHFEPCGLSQLISMRYGTVPVANKTGGLKDTVTEYNEESHTGTGFLCDLTHGPSFTDALNRALKLYQNLEHWKALQKNGMTGDYSWSRSAEEYIKVYDMVSRK